MPNDIEILLRAVDNASKVVSGANLKFTELKSAIGLAKQALQAINTVEEMLIGTTVDYANTVRKMTSTLDISSQEASRLIQVFDDFGVEANQLKTILEMAAKNGFEPSIENIAQLADETNAMIDPTQRAAALSKIFGRNWAEVSEVLRQGGNIIREQSAAISDSLVLTPQAIQQARDYEIALDNWNDSIMAVEVSVSTTLLPTLIEFMKVLNLNLQAIQNWNGEIEIYLNDSDKMAAVNKAYADQTAEAAKKQKDATEAIKDYERELLRAGLSLVKASAATEDYSNYNYYAHRAIDQVRESIKKEGTEADKVAEQIDKAAESMGFYARRAQEASRNSRNLAVGMEAVKNAQKALIDAQKEWTEGVGDDAANLLQESLPEGSKKLIEGLAALALYTGSTASQTAAMNTELDKANADYVSGKTTALDYAQQVALIATKYEELNKPITDARKELDKVNADWAYLLGNPVVDLLVNVHYNVIGTPPPGVPAVGGGGGGGGTGHPPGWKPPVPEMAALTAGVMAQITRQVTEARRSGSFMAGRK